MLPGIMLLTDLFLAAIPGETVAYVFAELYLARSAFTSNSSLNFLISFLKAEVFIIDLMKSSSIPIHIW